MITLSATFPVPPQVLYDAWLNSREHSDMTGAAAKVSNRVHGKFTAWDAYIFGHNQELVPHKKIVQAWRTTEFAESDPDSTLTLTFTSKGKGSVLKIVHANTPKSQEQNYKKGWKEFYLLPMKDYFAV